MAYQLSQDKCAEVVEKAAKKLAEYCIEYDLKYLVVGSSGGLDSAATLGLAEQAKDIAAEFMHDITIVGLIMPCDSKLDAERLGRQAIQAFGAEEIKIDLTDQFDHAMTNLVPDVDEQVEAILRKNADIDGLQSLDWSKKITQGNIRARLRMIFGTYHVARMFKKAMVLSTDNLSEYWMAFWTLHGDVGDYGMIQNVLKGLELYDIARYLGVPEGIINAQPDDGLGIAGGDADQIGAEYSEVDKIMIKLIQAGFNPNGSMDQLNSPLPKVEVEGIGAGTVRIIATRALTGQFKRLTPFSLNRDVLGLPSIKDIEL